MSTSPPWRTDDWSLGADLVKIDQQWVAIRRVLEDPSLFERSEPDISEWSAGGHAIHIVLVAHTIADRIEGNLADPERNREETTPELAHRVLAAGGFTRGVAEAPPETRPDRHTREEALSLLPMAIAAWERIRDRAPELADCPARARHFTLGHLSSIEWVRMCAVHTAHHLKVIRDIAGAGSLDPDFAESGR